MRKIELIYKDLVQYGCRAIYKTTFQLNNNNIYILFYDKNNSDVTKIREYVKKNRDELPKHFYLDYYDEQIHSCYLCEYFFIEKIIGDDVQITYNLDNHILSGKYLLKQSRYWINTPNFLFVWWICLLSLYILENNSINLTDEQWATINLAYNGQMTQELKTWCINKLYN